VISSIDDLQMIKIFNKEKRWQW